MTTSITIIVSIAIAIVTALITRQVFLWYWKVNKIVASIEEANQLMILSNYETFSSKTITVTNQATKKDIDMKISYFMNLPNKSLYKIKL